MDGGGGGGRNTRRRQRRYEEKQDNFQFAYFLKNGQCDSNPRLEHDAKPMQILVMSGIRCIFLTGLSCKSLSFTGCKILSDTVIHDALIFI